MRRVRTLLIVLVIGVVCLYTLIKLYYAYNQVELGRKEVVSITDTPVTISYLCPKNQYRITTFNKGDACSNMLHNRSGWIIYKLLAWNKKYSSWICIIKDDKKLNGLSQLVRLNQNNEKVIFDLDTTDMKLYNVSTFNDNIILPSLKNGSVFIRYCDLNGNVIREVTLNTRGNSVRSIDGPISVTKNGLMAVALSIHDDLKPSVYLFDMNGCILHRIGHGFRPSFSHDGKQVAYITCNDSDKSRYEVGVFSIDTESLDRIVVWRPIRMRDTTPYLMSQYAYVVSEVQWSDDDDYILCSMMQHKVIDQLLVGVSIRSKPYRRWYAPFTVRNGRWISVSQQYIVAH